MGCVAIVVAFVIGVALLGRPASKASQPYRHTPRFLLNIKLVLFRELGPGSKKASETIEKKGPKITRIWVYQARLLSQLLLYSIEKEDLTDSPFSKHDINTIRQALNSLEANQLGQFPATPTFSDLSSDNVVAKVGKSIWEAGAGVDYYQRQIEKSSANSRVKRDRSKDVVQKDLENVEINRAHITAERLFIEAVETSGRLERNWLWQANMVIDLLSYSPSDTRRVRENSRGLSGG